MMNRFQALLLSFAFNLKLRRYTLGQMWGYIGGTACIFATFVIFILLGVAGMSTNWSLGICAALSGARPARHCPPRH